MKREIIKTADGSATIYLPEWNEHYHSKHGALQEALHVFIKTGFYHFLEKIAVEEISILEIGFGTGLNALITYMEAKKGKISVNYTGIEAYPVASEELEKLDYAASFHEENASEVFDVLHAIPWEEKHEVSDFFQLKKEQKFFKELKYSEAVDLIYFDAFGPRVQPDLWTEEIFASMFAALKPGGVLVTYSAKGSVRRAMQAVGFKVERLPGPPGKREMLRATKS
ncbi:tRNA (5-methylaminomethyl-2-thiouridine)(34)-methyltransferase MnmD [Salinimicrobium soli]|uniref:tRNA (5-methylaminomethyl-2-thiouridine)(34)-methyltransferase MnmD n=1 Tax=Salinimicrobium soli TaxID=1254399 RepID=UPI003AAFFBFC